MFKDVIDVLTSHEDRIAGIEKRHAGPSEEPVYDYEAETKRSEKQGSNGTLDMP